MGHPDRERLEDRRLQERHGTRPVRLHRAAPRPPRRRLRPRGRDHGRPRTAAPRDASRAGVRGRASTSADSTPSSSRSARRSAATTPTSIHARAAEARKRDDVPWITQIGIAINACHGSPRMRSATSAISRRQCRRALRDLGADAVGLAIAALGIAMRAPIPCGDVALPASLRARRARKAAVARGGVRDRHGLRRLLLCLVDGRARDARGRKPVHPRGQVQRRRGGHRLARPAPLDASVEGEQHQRAEPCPDARPECRSARASTPSRPPPLPRAPT